jgi:twitching motility protein PilT
MPSQINSAQLLDVVIQRGASDLHIVANNPPFIRVSTKLMPIEDFPPMSSEDVEYFLSQLIDDQQRQLLEINKELDFSVSLGNKARFRVNAFYQKGVISVALRHIPLVIPAFESLHLPPNLNNITQLKQGLILVVGPTGQGKSTTLAAIMDRINETRPEHIVTIEDPIEYVFSNKKSLIEQREMYLDTNSWESALKSVLRQDPNIVLIGELRDTDTISAALQIAETGHLVFGTLHTNSASHTLERIIASFSSEKQVEVRIQLAQVIEVVISQRLLPTLDGSVAPAVEILLGTDAVKALIRDNKTHMIDNVISTSYQLGMQTLEKGLFDLISAGLVNFETALKYAARPEELRRLLGQRTAGR